MSKIVDIYCRIATDDGGNTGLDEQEAADREYCRAHDLTVGNVYREVSSGLNRDREGLNLMLSRCRTGDIQVVVVLEQSRLTRDTAHLMVLQEEMSQHSVTLYSVREEKDPGRVVWQTINN